MIIIADLICAHQIVEDICTEPGILVVCRWPMKRYLQMSSICCKYLVFDIRSNRDIADIWSNFVGKPVWYSEPQTGSGQLSYYIPSLGRQGRCCWCSKWSEIEINFLLLLFKKTFFFNFFLLLGCFYSTCVPGGMLLKCWCFKWSEIEFNFYEREVNFL